MTDTTKPAPVDDMEVVSDLMQLIEDRIDFSRSDWRAGLGSLITELETRHPGLVQERMAAQAKASMPCG